MTTPISDEQLAEIERDILAQAQIMSGQCEGGVWLRGGDCPKCQATRHDRCQFPLSQSYAIPSNVEALIARLRAAEAELSLWRPIMDEVERRAEKEWCLQDKRDFTVTIQYDDYVDIDAAMERTP
ncbi:TPA: hypothetical protein VDV69_006243 [Pseudomonas aeruginosa]|uniref:hypothetical protein n=1 Tax=Pseudomonas aeruginosa TaxID=287 RepID=UPI001153B5DC|nr:hypothetical protein [Pseudomonas aeruginosa]MBX5683529.1 hypothetical protein [Pseudomonas aeruginosa]MBX5757009.1 hypothetical protein [Pseudomonas aeruginosa]MBX6078267.1 hypothetical protein [Pseudomonas aeruginosa]MBX6121803.1 hypothetical protein [Pseudomonas aeruginosa]MBX6253969.1 hypothetical protein [Pseudomonas aeruginosa]